jgi:hypothetical protein
VCLAPISCSKVFALLHTPPCDLLRVAVMQRASGVLYQHGALAVCTRVHLVPSESPAGPPDYLEGQMRVRCMLSMYRVHASV